jgi:predicted MPP superfamily phosphohydrolase
MMHSSGGLPSREGSGMAGPRGHGAGRKNELRSRHTMSNNHVPRRSAETTEQLPRRVSMDDDLLSQLEQRLGRLNARQRLGIENDHEAQIFGQGLNFFHIENWYSIHSVIRTVLKLSGLYGRGCRNAERVVIRSNDVASPKLPPRFDGFTILHISDTHADISAGAMQRLAGLLDGLTYDLCVWTGDFRGPTFGPYDAALEGTAAIAHRLRQPVYGVLGNHDTIRMLPGLEAVGLKMLQNECATIRRDDEAIYLAGIDDAHYFRVDNIEKAAASIPEGAFAILLSHTPEIYRQAAHAGFDLLLSGHTHGGQICLPGSIPLTLSSVLPRRMGAGAWRYGTMAGYTSVGAGCSMVPVRFNCPPEITLHRLRRIEA